MKLIVSIIASILIILVLIFPFEAYRWGIANNVSWTLSALLNWLILILFSAIVVSSLRRVSKNRLLNLTIKTLVFCLPLGIYFARNPIYQGDYIKTDTEISDSENSIVKTIVASKPDFNGIVCIASPGCGFCKEATKHRLKPIKSRTDINVAIFLAVKDTAAIDYYISETNAPELDYFLLEEVDGLNEITQGRFPTFIYVKDKRIAHIWSNDNLGFPALDWIESGLK